MEEETSGGFGSNLQCQMQFCSGHLVQKVCKPVLWPEVRNVPSVSPIASIIPEINIKKTQHAVCYQAKDSLYCLQVPR